ncbi:MAG TPA: sulfite exporter TauE/SafE family protein [Sedimenticola sp.]|nr:sulfite exporter TauE/SafE family protein [Sedimenticola sp.]
MNAGFGYTLAFATGLMGAFHCLGMCGSFAGGFFAGHGWKRKFLPQVGYHGARILTYVLLGATGAALGRVVIQTGWVGKGQGLLMMLSGLAIVAIGLGLAGLLPGWRRRACPGSSGASCEVRVVRLEERGRWARVLPPVAGLVNGLVPCSLLFSVGIKAAATGDPLRAGLLMACFGLGTLPVMGLVTTLGAALPARAVGWAARLVGPTVILLGLWTLYEGFVFYDIMRGLAN